MMLCVFGGYISYTLSASNEEDVLHSQYTNSARQLQFTILDDVNSKISILRTLVAVVTINCNDASKWPNCAVPMKNFLNYADPMVETTKSRTIQYAPLVLPEEVDSFEDFAYDFYEASGYSELGVSSIGRGIHAVNATSGERYHCTVPVPGVVYDVLFPIFETGALDLNLNAIMYNVYSEEKSAVAIEAMLDCTYAAINAGELSALDIGNTCSSITDVIKLTQDNEFNPGVVLRYPIIVPTNSSNSSSPLKLVGLVAMVHNWNTALTRSTCDSELRVVVSNQNGAWSFSLECQTAVYLQEGNKHNSAYSSMGRTFPLPPFKGGVSYQVSIYPTRSLVEEFRSNGPVYVCVITVAVILLTSAVFMSYDHFVRGEVRKKEEAKTNFVRFISHEMRSPMNTVSLGLKLLYDQLCHVMSMYPTPPGIFENDDGTPPSLEVAIPANVIQEWKELVSAIEDGSDAAVDVLNSLINYDNIAAGVVLVKTTQLNLWQLVQHCVEQHEMEAIELDVSLRLDMAITRANVGGSKRKYLANLLCMGDETKLNTVVKNFISNSLKYTPPGGAILVTVDWKEAGLPYVASVEKDMLRAGSIVIRFIDNGVGMKIETLQHLFRDDEHIRIKSDHSGQGTGLGLRISKAIVEMHGGLISGKSDGTDRGCVFTVELPVQVHKNMRDLSLLEQEEDAPFDIEDIPCEECLSPSALTLSSFETNNIRTSQLAAAIDILHDSANGDSAGPHSAHQPRISTYEVCKAVEYEDLSSTRRQRVLVVDDVAVCRKVLIKTLVRSGYECYEAYDGQDCLDQYNRLIAINKPVDLVLMDYEMPRMNGPSAAQILREGGCMVPIIGVTGNVLLKDKENFLSHGASAVLFKPLALDHLKTTIVDLNGKSKGNEI